MHSPKAAGFYTMRDACWILIDVIDDLREVEHPQWSDARLYDMRQSALDLLRDLSRAQLEKPLSPHSVA